MIVLEQLIKCFLSLSLDSNQSVFNSVAFFGNLPEKLNKRKLFLGYIFIR